MKRGWKRIHRLVVLPDYQGIGIGTKFITKIAEMYANDGYEINLTTTTPGLVKSLRKNKHWRLIRYGREKSKMDNFIKQYGKLGIGTEHLTHASSQKRVTYSFFYRKGGRTDG